MTRDQIITNKANLSLADLIGADLRGANLSLADLSRADLRGADLIDTILPPISILPRGALIGWKKLRDGVIAELSIGAEVARVNSTGRKCRAESAVVLSLSVEATTGYSSYDGTEYKVGETVIPDKFDPDFRVECSHGIHFFITRQEAVDY